MRCPSRQAHLAIPRSSRRCPGHGYLNALTSANLPLCARHYLDGARKSISTTSLKSIFGPERSYAACCRYVVVTQSKLLSRVLTTNCKGSDIGLLMQAHVNEGVVRGPPPPSSALAQVISRRNGSGLMHGIPLLRFRATTHGLYQALLPVLSKTQGSRSEARRATLLLCLPEPIVSQALPEMVAAYHASHHTHVNHASHANGPTYIDLTDDSDTLDNGSNVIDLTIV